MSPLHAEAIIRLDSKNSGRTEECHIFNRRPVIYCKSYKYLGTTLDEFLNFEKTAAAQADPAGRALGALITKTIKNGGLPYSIYTMLFESAVCSVSDYV